MSTFIEMVNRIATELRRSNLTDNIKTAVNDAIAEGAKTRFYFNEMRIDFDTLTGEEYYDDFGLVEIDSVYYLQGDARVDVEVISQLDMNDLVAGTSMGGPVQYISRYQGRLRLYPIPATDGTLNVDGYGVLFPSPLVEDDDTNAWLDEGEQYIRALAKRNVVRDVIRDYGEARVIEAISEDYKQQLVEATAMKSATGTLRSTEF